MAPASKSPPQAVYLLPLASFQSLPDPHTPDFQRYYGFSEEESWQAVEYYREYYREKGIYENRVYEGLGMDKWMAYQKI